MKKVIQQFSKKHILVLGDVMLDEFLIGDVSRINPEAPVPVLHVKSRIFKPGGAANVASNVVSLGAKCTLIGRVGKDNAATILKKSLDVRDINHKLVIDDVLTIRKTRSIAQNQHLLRVDFENNTPMSAEQTKKALANIKKIKNVDLIIISDYNKGFITKELMSEIKKLNIPIIADIKPQNKELFSNVHLITPNLKEAQKLSGISGTSQEIVEQIGKKLVTELNTNVIITRSKDGISLFEKNSAQHHIPTNAVEVYDVTGAGDTVIGAIGLSIASNASLTQSAIIANHAAGVVVGKVGTATTTQKELISQFNQENKKIKAVSELKEIVSDLKLKNKKIVFTNGCFDILHTGHIKLLREAKKQGNVLIVGLNTDDSVKKFKGPKRPHNNQFDRSEIIATLEFVDYVTLFDQDTPSELIKALRPDIHVKGGDYDPQDYDAMPEAKIVHDYKGKIHIVPLKDNKSTTNLIEKIKK
ncbi:D-glycero-beta-D-manno-heptose 1-phosphate adenylyltransferase [Candidatus Woesearchaeota archaeon]|nr:D-glycero-beta-D-manno-heptose 1-phosphate adenylyltransferase [Candidatus Woesearchaeota archaeon]